MYSMTPTPNIPPMINNNSVMLPFFPPSLQLPANQPNRWHPTNAGSK